MAVLTPRQDDFPRWYQDVLTKAKLAENGPARGTIVIRPNGYAIWERMQDEIDRRIKDAGARNAYFPLLIPMNFFEREAEHVEGFSPELAVVTHGGGRSCPSHSPSGLPAKPSSASTWPNGSAATGIYRCFSTSGPTWCGGGCAANLPAHHGVSLAGRSHRARHGVRRSAVRPRHPARRVRGFHAKRARHAVIVGRKTAKERFAGAVNTMTCEAIMRDGKALQMGTSHELGQRFSRAFNISYSSADGATELCWTTSWGSSTRMLGGLIMCHGDDFGSSCRPHWRPSKRSSWW